MEGIQVSLDKVFSDPQDRRTASSSDQQEVGLVLPRKQLANPKSAGERSDDPQHQDCMQ